jgi:hypothetical protein
MYFSPVVDCSCDVRATGWGRVPGMSGRISFCRDQPVDSLSSQRAVSAVHTSPRSHDLNFGQGNGA